MFRRTTEPYYAVKMQYIYRRDVSARPYLQNRATAPPGHPGHASVVDFCHNCYNASRKSFHHHYL